MDQPKPRTKGAAQSTPEAYPTSPPKQLRSGDLTYILEIVMNMQTSVGKLVEAVDSLKTQSKDQDRKHEDIAKEVRAVAQDVHGAKVVMTVVGTFITVAIAIVGSIAIPMLFKIVDLGINILKKVH